MNIKNYALKFMTVALLVSCGSDGQYGQTVEIEKAIPIDQAVTDFKSKGSAEATVKGEIAAVCQSEGCWFNYKTADGDLFVDFEHKFEIPKTVKGKNATSTGRFSYDTTSVEQLKEYAKDDGKTQSEIDSISAPEIRLIFIAKGVKIE